MKGSANNALNIADRQLAEELVAEVKHYLRNAVKVKWSPELEGQLMKIFRDAHEFYRLLVSQDVQFCVEMPPVVIGNQLQRFDPAGMELMHGTEDDATLCNELVVMSVFPAVYKLGNTSNGSVSNRYLLWGCMSTETDLCNADWAQNGRKQGEGGGRDEELRRKKALKLDHGKGGHPLRDGRLVNDSLSSPGQKMQRVGVGILS